MNNLTIIFKGKVDSGKSVALNLCKEVLKKDFDILTVDRDRTPNEETLVVSFKTKVENK